MVKKSIILTFFLVSTINLVCQELEDNIEVLSQIFELEEISWLSEFQEFKKEKSFIVYKDDKVIPFYLTISSLGNIYFFSEAELYRNDINYFFVVDSFSRLENEIFISFHTSSRMLNLDTAIDKQFFKIKIALIKEEDSWEVKDLQMEDEICCKW